VVAGFEPATSALWMLRFSLRELYAEIHDASISSFQSMRKTKARSLPMTSSNLG